MRALLCCTLAALAGSAAATPQAPALSPETVAPPPSSSADLSPAPRDTTARDTTETPAPLPDRPARICLAVANGDTATLRSWAEQGVDLDVICARPFSPLGMAAFRCEPDLVETLLGLGADTNVCVPPYGKTTCGSSGGLGGTTSGAYPLAQADARAQSARDEGDAERVTRCEATAALLRSVTGRVPQDLRPASEN